MPGGLIQLTTYGAQDLYLTGKPEISFFKSVYRRYTNYSTEMIEVAPTVEKKFTNVPNAIKFVQDKIKKLINGEFDMNIFIIFYMYHTLI